MRAPHLAFAPIGSAFTAMLAGAVVATVYLGTVRGLGLSEEDRAALRSLRLRAQDRAGSLDRDQAGFMSEG